MSSAVPPGSASTRSLGNLSTTYPNNSSLSAALVVVLAVVMRRAVQFHDQLGRLADEVREVAVDRDLPQEPEPAEAPIADEGPEHLLGQGLVSPKSTSVCGLVHDQSMGRGIRGVQRQESRFSGWR